MAEPAVNEGSMPSVPPSEAGLRRDGVESPREGVNVVGYLTAESGIGEAARKLLAALSAAGIPVNPVNYAKNSPSRQVDRLEPIAGGAGNYRTNLVCLNAAELPDFAFDAGPEFFVDRYTIGFWWWELPVFPRPFHGALRLVDEIWVGSRFVADAIGSETSIPIHVVPLPVEPPPETVLGRRDLGLSDEFMFLFSFDFFGVFERKNPIAVVEAFKRAFAPGSGPQLVIKSMNGDRYPEEMRRLRIAVGVREDVRIVDGYWSEAEKNALTASCDCYVSLHRAEGYGLGLAEAMARGKPVVATRYSGNLDFMNDDVAHLVGYRIVDTPPGCAPYPAGAPWADPDVDEAAARLRDVFGDPAEARALGRRAREHVLGSFPPERTARFVADRIRAQASFGPVERESPIRDWLAAVVGTTLERVEAELESADALRNAATRYGAPMRTWRRSLYRALWPYFFRERAMNSALLEALRALADVQARQAAQLEDLRRAVTRLEANTPGTAP